MSYRSTKNPIAGKLVVAFLLLIFLGQVNPAAGVAAAVLYLVFGVSGSAKKNAREDRPSRNVTHSHDRLDPNIKMENGLDHYKIQLDGFLKAGIIDRKEYDVLLKKYSDTLRTR